MADWERWNYTLTEENKRFTALDDETPERYIVNKEADFLIILNSAFEAKEITESYYNFARLNRCDEYEWDAVFEHFTSVHQEFSDQVENKGKYLLIERIEKGAEYLERTNITKQQREGAKRLYDQLCKELGELMLKELEK